MMGLEIIDHCNINTSACVQLKLKVMLSAFLYCIVHKSTYLIAAPKITLIKRLFSACTNGTSIALVEYILDLGIIDINHQGQDKHTGKL